MNEVLKTHDSLVAVLFAGRSAQRLVPLAQSLRVSPNTVTMASFLATILAALLIAFGGTGAGVLAAALIAGGFVLDCLDGQLARATGTSSDFGRYLDSLTDLVKVFALIVALAATAGEAGVVLGAAAFFGYLLCEYHMQLVKTFRQRSQDEYERTAAPWKERLQFKGQKIDVAFAIGEVLATLALGAAFGEPEWALGLIAVVAPIQFLSYSVRFWKHRYERPSER